MLTFCPRPRLFECLLTVSLLGVSVVSARAQTSSPFAPPTEKLGVYVTNGGPGLDTGCTYRSGGPLLIRFRVPAVVNASEVKADGTLKNPQKLITAGLIGAQATLRMPVFDIDSSASPGGGINPEVDRLSVNGRFKKTLTGVNNTWTDDSLVVPIGELRFDSPSSPGVTNELRVDIDTANSVEAWCMAVDWVSTEFDAAAPYVLSHGIDAGAESWDGFAGFLTEKGILFARFSLEANGRSATNAALLEATIETFLQTIKSTVVHVIAHSKGGLDTQELQARGPSFKILSLSTLSTPHLGSVAGDLSIIASESADELKNTGRDPKGYVKTFVNQWTFGQGPQLPGLRDLTTYRATEAIGAHLRGNINPTFTFGADADLNHNNDLTVNESAGLFPAAAHYAAERSWRVMRDFSSASIVSIVETPNLIFGTTKVVTYNSVEAATAQANDIVVTRKSANPAYGRRVDDYFANHSTIKNKQVLDQILEKTIPLR